MKPAVTEQIKRLRRAQARANKDLLEMPALRAIRAAGLPEPVREVKFHPSRKWRFDFAWPGLMVALEVEGATWAAGRHTRGAGYRSDCVKYAEAAILGWIVIRATGTMIKDGSAIELVQRAFEARG